MNAPLQDESITVETVFGALRIIVTREALLQLRGETDDPRDGPALLAANQEMIVQAATMKFEADEAEDNFVVRLTERDLEP